MADLEINERVYNYEYYDSSEDEEDDNFEDIDEINDYDTADEESDDLGEKLQDLLIEVSVVDVIGKKAFRLDFIDTSDLVFTDADEICDFDIDNNKIPIMPDGGEQFLLPYMKKICKIMPKFKNCILETNVRGQKFKT